MEDDFEDIEDIQQRIFHALKDRFDSSGFVVFDEKFAAKPSVVRPGQSPKWGGYTIVFKIIEKEKATKLQSSIDDLRRNAAVIGSNQQRVFSIDISKHEFCTGKEEVTLDNYIIYVYTLPMLAIEKLRALCQQLSGYAHQTTPRARARDYYDIHAIVTQRNIDLTTADSLQLIKNIFAAKEVPLSFLGRLSEQRDFHRENWSDVIQSVPVAPKRYDFYVDFVLELVERLKSLGIK